MANRNGAAARALRIASEDEHRVLAEIARAQRSAGVSDEEIGRACRMSRWTVARTLAAQRRASVKEIAVLGSTVGLQIRMQAYPGGDPIRDTAQQRLLERFRRQLHPSIEWRTEVPLPSDRDLRAWDAVIRGPKLRSAIEAETTLDDLQAVERRIRLKMRDGAMESVILVVADTRRNRAALAAAPAALAGFSRNTRSVLAAVREGEAPDSAILFL